MSQSGPDFALPDEILSVIPSDPYSQLDLARKITSLAIATRVSNLEEEAAKLGRNLQEKDRYVEELESKVSRLEADYRDAESRLKTTSEDNVKLLSERDNLALTAKKLTRDLAKLETFKRQLMQSLNDENSPPKEAVDIGMYDQSVPKNYLTNDNHKKSNGYPKYPSYNGSNDNASRQDVSKQGGQRFSMTQNPTPRLSPTGTPKVISYSAAVSPQRTSGATSPTNQFARRGSLSSWYPSSQQSSAANSPPRGPPLPGRNPRIDGKEFFRQARSRLSLEQFSAFLTNIKDLNAQKQSREETLKTAEEIFGLENKDLYALFQGLLSRNVH